VIWVAVERQVELIAFKNHPDGVEAVMRHLNGRNAPFNGGDGRWIATGYWPTFT
jgi:hypothetical protein